MHRRKLILRNPYLSGGISLDDVANAFTDPNKRFEFPIKPMTYQIDLTPRAQLTIFAAAGMITAGMIYLATRKNK